MPVIAAPLPAPLPKMSVLLLFLVISLLTQQRQNPSEVMVFSHLLVFVFCMAHTHPAIVFRHLWAIRDIPNRFILSGRPVHFLLLAVHTV